MRSIRPIHPGVTAMIVGAIALVAVGVDRGHAQTPVEQTPVVPAENLAYPLGTPLTGPCDPTTRPSGDGRVTRTHTSTSFVHGEPIQDFVYDHPVYSNTQAIKPEGVYYEDRCGARDDASGSNNPGVLGNGVPGFAPSNQGSWWMYPIKTTTEYEYDDQDSMSWIAVDEHHEILGTINFRTYDPCHFMATDVRGRVLKGRPGGRPERVRKGTIIAQGDTLTVQNDGKTPGRALLRSDVGSSLGFGPGEFQFSDTQACKKFWEEGRHTWKLPEDPAQAEVKKGWLEQRFDELNSIVKSGKDLYNEGIFSNLRHRRGGARDEGQGRFKVTRRKGTTRSCAIEEGLRVYTKSKTVPEPKRELILEEGQCALTKDGGAPRRVKS